MKVDSYTVAVLKFAARVADKTGPFAFVLVGVALVGYYLIGG